MPTYEFRCPDGHTFERFYRKISDAVSEVACPECGKPATRLLTGGAGLVFKGSGFYLTDYGKNAHRKSGDNGSAGKGASAQADGAPSSGEGASKSGESGRESRESRDSSKAESSGSESKATAAKSSDAKAGSAPPPAPTPKSDKPKSDK